MTAPQPDLAAVHEILRKCPHWMTLSHQLTGTEMPKLKPDEKLWICSMGKKFQVTGIFQSDDEANDHCQKNRDVGVIAVAGGFIFVARLYSGHPQTEPEGVVATKSTAPQVFY